MPISDCEVRDPRVRRTRQLLQGALARLLETRSFEEISVQDIAEAATVNRATFYDHYTDKFALLDAWVAGGFHMLLAERSVQYEGTCPGQIAAVVLAACEYLSQRQAGCAGREGRNLMDALQDAAITAAIRRVVEAGVSRHGDVPADERAIQAAAVSGAIYGAVKEWLYTPQRPEASEIVPEIVRMVQPLLEAGGAMQPGPQEAEAIVR